MATSMMRFRVFDFLTVSNKLTFVRSSGYKSVYSLDKLYPESSLNPFKEQPIPQNEEIFSGHIPVKSLTISYCRASGPGGQNVNKVNSKAEIRFKLSTATWIPLKVRTKMQVMHKNFLNKGGEMVLSSDKTRSQQLNLADCMDKLRCYIWEAAKEPPVIPPETKARIKARQERASAERLRIKRHQAVLRSFREV